MPNKAIITCALTGGVATPSMSPYLPITPDQITAEAVAAAEAGAAIIHLHARDPETGKPDPTPERFMEFLPRIKQQTDAILNVTTGGGQGMTLEERFAAALTAKPELASMNMGSMNFALFEAVDRIPVFKHDWEKPYLENSKHSILSNTFAQIEYGMRALGEHGTRFEYECYDVSHLYNLAFFADRGLVKPPFFIQCIFGILGGIGPDPENLLHMRGVADRLFGKDYQLSVLGAGKHQMPFATLSAVLGGNVRVGIEDNLFLGRGKLAKSNAEQVVKIRRILDELGIDIATPAEARAILGTKGGENVAF